jgi:hypothetical protein
MMKLGEAQDRLRRAALAYVADSPSWPPTPSSPLTAGFAALLARRRPAEGAAPAEH